MSGTQLFLHYFIQRTQADGLSIRIETPSRRLQRFRQTRSKLAHVTRSCLPRDSYREMPCCISSYNMPVIFECGQSPSSCHAANTRTSNTRLTNSFDDRKRIVQIRWKDENRTAVPSIPSRANFKKLRMIMPASQGLALHYTEIKRRF